MALKQAGYGQTNLMEYIVRRLSAKFQHQANMVNIAPPKYPSPSISTVTAEILQQFFAQNQDLMRLISYNSG